LLISATSAEVTPAGSKLWRLPYRTGKIEKKLSIGSYAEVSLKQAWDAIDKARQAVASGAIPRWRGASRRSALRASPWRLDRAAWAHAPAAISRHTDLHEIGLDDGLRIIPIG
jgi:hypothetical protein